MTFIKTPMYRRGKGGPNDGLKERAMWLLSKGPMTATALAGALRVPRSKIVQVIRDTTSGNGCVASVTAQQITTGDGTTDRLYTLNGKVNRVAPKVTPQKTIVVSMKSLGERGEDKRQAAEDAAARRRRLMSAGLYITASDLLTPVSGRDI